MRVPLALLAVATLLLPGCITAPQAPLEETAAPAGPVPDLASLLPKLSPRLGNLSVLHEVVDVETPHGLVNVDLYLPEVPPGHKVPVILVASPYNNPNAPLNALGGGGKSGEDNWINLPLYNWIRKELLPRGYGLAQMDILGTRNSGGCMGLMNPAERQATAAVVDWLGTQEWSSGKVGMIGKSYLGLSQMGAAVEKPEHLVTIVPISGPTHDYAYHYYNGVPYLGNHLTNSLYYGVFSLPPPDGDLLTYAPRYPERLPCMPEGLAWSVASLGDYDQHWQERDYRPLVPQMSEEVSVFFIHGHQDWNVKPDHVLDVYNAFPGPKMGLWGQWGHDYPNINNYDEERWGEREDWYLTLHRWFDHWLLGIDTGLLQEMAACPVQTQGYDGAWRCTQAFPPLPEEGDPVTTLTLHPTSAGGLAAAPATGTAQYTDDPALPATLVVREVPFRSEAFANATRIVGAPEIRLRLTTTSPFNTFAVAALAIERENGDRDEFTWGYQSLRHRNTLTKGEPVVPGTAYDLTFKLYPVDHVVYPGERLVLVLRGESEDTVSILPNPTPGVQTVDLSATALTLPLLPTDRAFAPLTADDLPDTYHLEG